jgi:hypothetical protein
MEKRQLAEAEEKRLTNRAEALEDKQMQLLDAEIANLGAGGVNEQVRKEASDAATEYLGKWNTALSDAQGVYSNAVSEVNKAGELIDRAYGNLDELDAVGQEVKSEWDTFKKDFGGAQGAFLQESMDALGDRKTLRRSFMDLTKGDYQGVSSRAMTDVASQAESGRQAEAMRLQGLGIDPTSGKARTFMQESRDAEGLSKVMAANKAVLGEKERVAGITAQGLSLIDPSKDLGAAAQIQELSSNLLSQRTNLATTKAGLSTDLAKSRTIVGGTLANIGSGMARDIAAPYGEYGAAQQGVAQANTGTTATSGGASPGDFAALQKKTSDMYKSFYG